jgi:hypothetical protein
VTLSTPITSVMAMAHLIGLGPPAESGESLKSSRCVDERHFVAPSPPSGASAPSQDLSSEADLNTADWHAAEQRRRGATGEDVPDATVRAARLPVDFAADWPRADAGAEGAPPSPVRDIPRWKKRQRLLRFTRAWAAVKMSISAASTWLTMSSLHAKSGEWVCAYGVACFWWAIGPHWRKRCFGPGQKLEPELYEGVARWCWGVGTVLVLGGSVIYFLQLS